MNILLCTGDSHEDDHPHDPTPAEYLECVPTISDESKASELFRENRYVDSDRGKELRLVGLRKEGSPLVSQKRKGEELVTRKDDLYLADSIFKHGIYMYEVSAGVTASQGQSEDALFAEAKRNLDVFLKGLKIQ